MHINTFNTYNEGEVLSCTVQVWHQTMELTLSVPPGFDRLQVMEIARDAAETADQRLAALAAGPPSN